MGKIPGVKVTTNGGDPTQGSYNKIEAIFNGGK